MSLQLRLFGGGKPAVGKLSASNDGNHAIDKSKVLAQTDARTRIDEIKAKLTGAEN
jgi:hypothetical protein